jgi:hypothetical protein
MPLPESSVGVLLIENPSDFAALAMASEFVPGADVRILREEPGPSRDNLALWYARRAVGPDEIAPLDIDWLSERVVRALRAGGAVVSIIHQTSSTGAGELVSRYEEFRRLRGTVGFWSELMDRTYDNAD